MLLLILQEHNHDLNETFHDQLDKAEDGFSLVADYFGRGVFNRLTVVTDVPLQMPLRMYSITNVNVLCSERLKEHSSDFC